MSIVERTKNILLSPAKEWLVIKDEQATVKDLFMKYAVLLAAIPAAAGFIGFSVFGISWGFGSYQFPFGLSIKWALTTYVMSLVSVYVLAFIMDFLAPNFGASKDMVASMKVVVYAYTASWVGGIFNVMPTFSILAALAGIYSLVLLYQGMKTVKAVPQEKMVGYFVSLIIAAVVVFLITGWVVTAFAFGGSIESLINPY